MVVKSFLASCPGCGEVSVAPRAVQLFLDGEGGATDYGFECPSCERSIRQTASPATAELLQELGSPVFVEQSAHAHIHRGVAERGAE